MPQLDLYSILNQFFWGSFFFVLFYYCITFFFVPTFFASLYARKAFTESRIQETFCFAGVVFLSHVLISLAAELLFDNFNAFLDYVIYAKVVSSSVYATSFDFDFEKLQVDEERA